MSTASSSTNRAGKRVSNVTRPEKARKRHQFTRQQLEQMIREADEQTENEDDDEEDEYNPGPSSSDPEDNDIESERKKTNKQPGTSIAAS